MSYLYLFQRSDDPSLLKVGRSDNPSNRALALQKHHAFHIFGTKGLPRQGHSRSECAYPTEGIPGSQCARVRMVPVLSGGSLGCNKQICAYHEIEGSPESQGQEAIATRKRQVLTALP